MNKGFSGRKHKELSISKMIVSRTGKKQREDTKRKRSNKQIGNSRALGKKWSNESKQNVSKENNWRWNGGSVASLERKKKMQEEKAGRPKPKNCEICNSSSRICFDHNHNTGRFRGWICHKCNVILGLSNENYDVLLSLSNYLKKHE